MTVRAGATLYPPTRSDPLNRAVAFTTETASRDRLRIALLSPTGPSRGSVVFSVGRSEQIEKYGEVAGEFVERGFTVLLQEWAGQGLSGRDHRDPLRAHAAGGWQRHLANFDHVLASFSDMLPRPWIAAAHSMGGGLIALALAKGEQRFQSAILCAPMCGPNTEPFPRVIASGAARMAEALGMGGVLARRQLDYATLPFEVNMLTHDRARFERNQAVLRTHPALQLGEPTFTWVRYAFEIRRELRRPGAAEAIQIPVSIIAAEDDDFVDNGDLQHFARRLPRGSVEFVVGSYHEVLMESDARRAIFWRAFDRLAV
ncbi:MAG TPA: alpha/beta hydrolase [Vicinamibacterales bacterium]|nr:alpha/beta hydrolase [Vicinamibacterales bacterium]